jgi:hypothetical protein
MGRCGTVLERVGALLKWAAAGAVLGLAGGALFGLLTATLWLVFTADLARAVSNCWLFALAGAAAGLILAVFAWWEHPVSKVDGQARIIVVARMTCDSSAESNGHGDMEERWTRRPAQAGEPFSGETRGRKIE